MEEEEDGNKELRANSKLSLMAFSCIKSDLLTLVIPLTSSSLSTSFL